MQGLVMKNTMCIISLAMWVQSMLSGCSAEDDGASPGLCALKCSDAKIAGNDARFRLVSSTGAIDCSGVQVPAGQNAVEYLGPVTVQFVAESVRKLTYTNPLDPTAASQQNQAEDTAGKIWTPLAGIAFEPLILRGLMAGAKTSPENATIEADGKVSPFKYAGVVTPKSEWCSDSCGVASVEIWPICVQNSLNEVSVVIHSGALYAPELPLNVTAAPAAALRSENSPEAVDGTESPQEDQAQP
jgi:hypothetical protein